MSILSKLNHQNVCYVDGSFNDHNPETPVYGGSAIFVSDDTPTASILKTAKVHGNRTDFLVSRNIAGEVSAVKLAIKLALDAGMTNLTIYHDYSGLGHWARHEWKANRAVAKDLQAACDQAQNVDGLTLTFIWVKGHDGIRFNEACDKLAKEACGIN